AKRGNPGSMNTRSRGLLRRWPWVPGSRLRRAPERRTREALLRALAAQELAHGEALRPEGLAQHRHAFVRIGLAAHEDVERGVVGLGPGVDGDVAFRQHGDPGDAAVGLEMMQMDVQQRRT